MKKLLVTLSLVLMALITVSAQEQTPVDKMVTTITNAANLNPDQVTKIRPMVEKFVAAKEANKQKYASDEQGMKTANKANAENLKEQLKTVLSAEQMEKLDEFKKQKQERQEKANNQ